MDNPKFIFFADECTDQESLEAADINSRMYQYRFEPELLECVKRIVPMLIARGYRILRQSRGAHGILLSKPEFCKAAYIGTFLNTFTYKKPVKWYYNKWTTSEKYIAIGEVGRHNGTVKNSSLRLCVYGHRAAAPKYYTSEQNEYDERGRIIGKYMNDWVSTNESDALGCQIRKFKPTVSDKVLTKILDAAEAWMDSYTITDPSCFEKDCNDYPKDTTEEYEAYKKKEEEQTK